jgi:hypothetical protein
MTQPLPTAQELEKLPLRVVVAYASRTARRLSSELRGIVADEILDNVLQIVDLVSTASFIDDLDTSAIIRAAQHVAGAYAASSDESKSLEKFRIVFSITHTAITAMSACEAAADPSHAGFFMKRAAGAAERAVRALEVLDAGAAAAAVEAARRDYETFLAKYGEHEEVIVGEPIHCFDDAPE